MNGEVAQIRDIVIYARHALKTKNKIDYLPFEYEKNIEFLFIFNLSGIFEFLDEIGNKICMSSKPNFKQYLYHSSIVFAL